MDILSFSNLTGAVKIRAVNLFLTRYRHGSGHFKWIDSFYPQYHQVRTIIIIYIWGEIMRLLKTQIDF